MFEVVDGVPFTDEVEVMRLIAEKGVRRSILRVPFDTYHCRFIETWDVMGHLIMTERDIRYAMNGAAEVGDRHVCEHHDGGGGTIPRERWR